jgi:YHS domain-containing protein
MPSRRSVLVLLSAAGAAFAIGSIATSGPAAARSAEVYTGLVAGVAVGGYDPVAYFTEGAPRRGSSDITLEHGGATWRFASEANRDAFKSDPDRYSPRYGGYCAWAVGQGYLAKGDPQAWSVVDGRLYLNYDKRVQRTWERDIPGHVRRADANWPTVLAK